MALVDMTVGDPLKLDKDADVIVFLLPTQGTGKGYAATLSAALSEDVRPIGRVFQMYKDGRSFYGVTAYEADDHTSAPEVMTDFLSRLSRILGDDKPIVDVVISGLDMKTEHRFKFMKTLCRAKLQIKLFDFPHP